MKQARIFLGLITIALATRTATLRAQPSSEDEIRSKPGLSLDVAREQYDQAFKREAEFFENAVPHLGDGGVREWSDEQRKKLRDLVEKTFQARQELQRAELRELHRRLDAIGRAMHDREQHKDVVIDARVNQLIRNDAASDGYAEVVEQRVENGEVKTIRRRVPVKGIHSPVLPAPAYVEEEVQTDGGTQRIRKPVSPPADGFVEREEQHVDENGQVVTTRRRVPVKRALTAPVPLPTAVLPPAKVRDENAPAPPAERKPLPADEFDIETRERLAELDVQAEEEDYAAAEKKVENVRRLREQNAVSESELWLCENERRHAAIELKRAKTKLEGVARQRAELEEAAEAAVAQATAQHDAAAAKLRESEAACDAARGELTKTEADIQAAVAKVAYEQKQYDRFKNLIDQKAVDANLLPEREDALEAAKASLAAAKASVTTAKAKLNGFESAIEGARAGLAVAKARLDAATAHRDRLIRRTPAEPSA